MSAATASPVTRAKVDVPLAYDVRADAGAVAVLRRLLAVIRDNVDGAIEGSDDEYLHQLRIAVRRSRTVQRQLAGVFPHEDLPGFRSDFRWLQQATGPARDLDVYVTDFGWDWAWVRSLIGFRRQRTICQPQAIVPSALR
jgi:inorganic triphosphatase YgiF